MSLLILAQPMAVVVALSLACMFIAVLIVVVISSVNELAGHAEKYTKRINSMVQWVVRWGEYLGMDISTEGMTEKLTHHTGFLSELVVKGVGVIAEELSNGFLSKPQPAQVSHAFGIATPHSPLPRRACRRINPWLMPA